MGSDNGREVFDDFFILSEFLGGGVDMGEVRSELRNDSSHGVLSSFMENISSE